MQLLASALRLGFDLCAASAIIVGLFTALPLLTLLSAAVRHFLLSPPALEVCSGVTVDLEARGGEKPSDHAPVICKLEV